MIRARYVVPLVVVALAAPAAAQVIDGTATGGAKRCRSNDRVVHAIVKTRDVRISLPSPAPGHVYLVEGHGRDRTRIHVRVRPGEVAFEAEGDRARMKVRCGR